MTIVGVVAVIDRADVRIAVVVVAPVAVDERVNGVRWSTKRGVHQLVAGAWRILLELRWLRRRRGDGWSR